MTREEAVRLPRIEVDVNKQKAPGPIGCARPLWGGAARDPARHTLASSHSGHHEAAPSGNRTAYNLPQERSVSIVLREPQYIKGLIIGGWRKDEHLSHASDV